MNPNIINIITNMGPSTIMIGVVLIIIALFALSENL